MYSEEIIQKLANDELLMKLEDYLITYRISPSEKLRRSIRLSDFWVEAGDTIKRLKKEMVQNDALVMEKCCRYYEYWYKLKLICDGKALSPENLSKFDLNEVFEFKNSVLGITPDDD